MQVITTQNKKKQKGIEKIQFSKHARHVFFCFSQVQNGLVQNTCEIPYIYLPVSMSGYLTLFNHSSVFTEIQVFTCFITTNILTTVCYIQS